MKLAMISCAAYADAWPGFFGLLSKFWPDHPPMTIITDTVPDGYEWPVGVPVVQAGNGKSWCECLAAYCSLETEESLIMQEDFLLTAPVRTDLIAAAAAQLGPDIGGVRLYPCPGGVEPLTADPCIGIAGPSYRVSCQATIFQPAFLVELLTAIGPGSAAHFEIEGSKACRRTMLAWMRDSLPYPVEYLCTAIVRGEWLPEAKELCDLHGIQVDFSKRPMREAVHA